MVRAGVERAAVTLDQPPPTHRDDAPPPERPAGDRLGPYELHAELGRGGFGVVRRAWRPELRRWFAIKVLIAGADAPPELLARFAREAEAVALLGKHPAIAEIHDVGQDGGRHYIVMDLIEGQPIDRWVDDHPGDWRGVVGLMARVAEGVAHAHARGVIHRDLKPPNILVDGQGQPKVLDFGLAKLREGDGVPMTRSGAAVGTPDYMAPEQVAGNRSAVGTWTDVHALGAIIYELFAGPPPFAGGSMLEVMRRIAVEEPRPLHLLAPTVPREVSWVVQRALAKEPLARYGTARELAEELRRLERGEPVLAGPPTWTYRAGKFMRRHRGPLAVAAAAALALAGLGAWSVWRIVRERDEARAARAEVEATLAELRASMAREAELRDQDDRAQRARSLIAEGERLAVAGATPDRAREPFDAAVAIWPEQPEPLVARAREHLRRGRLAAALADCAAAEALNPRYHHTFVVEARIHLARGDPAAEHAAHIKLAEFDLPNEYGRWNRALAASRAGRFGDALALYDEALQLNPGFAIAHHNRGAVLQRLGRREEAAAAFRRSLDVDPRDLVSRRALAMVLGELGRIDEALAEVDRALAQAPDDPMMHAARADVLISATRLPEALEAFAQALAFDPEHLPTLINRGLLLTEVGRYDEAIADLTRARALKPDSPEVLGNLAEAYREAGRPEEALAVSDDACARHPDQSFGHSTRGAALATLGRWREAAAAYERAAAIEPTRALPRATLAFITWEYEGRRDEALALADRVVAECGHDPEAWWGRARLRFLGGDADGAVADLDHALRRSPYRADWHLTRGAALRDLGQIDEAEVAFGRAVTLAPAVARHWLERGRTRLKRDDLEGARADLDAALERDAGLAEARYLRAGVRYRSDDPEGARADAEEAAAAAPTDGRPVYLLAILAHQRGEYDAAWRQLRRAEALGHPPQPDFLAALQAAAPEPKDG